METTDRTECTFTSQRLCVCMAVHPRTGPMCEGCLATDAGINCWEMETSPCCSRSRAACESCTVLAAAMRSLTLVERARLILANGATIEGEVYCRPDQRLSDALNDPRKHYLAITDATVRHPSAGESAEHHDVVLVSKQAVHLVLPRVQ